MSSEIGNRMRKNFLKVLDILEKNDISGDEYVDFVILFLGLMKRERKEVFNYIMDLVKD